MHPLSDDIRRQTNIDQSRISHIVTDCRFEGNILKGTVESANTVMGQDFRGLIRQGMEAGFSMRGVGGVSKKVGDTTVIDGPIFIIAYDWVMFPSHPNAYMEKILKEDTNLNPKKQALMEGTLLKFSMNDLANYIAESSKNVKELAEHVGFDIRKDNLSIDKGSMSLCIHEDNNILKVFLEDSIQKELHNLFLEL